MVGKEDPTGAYRELKRDKGTPLAGKSTLNRLELTPKDADSKSRYKKIVMNQDGIDNFFVDVFIASYSEPPAQIILDADATDNPLHGNQDCYLPLYIFCGDELLCARLRQSNNDASAGTVEELERIVSRIRAAWPTVKIVIRGDSGFCRENIMKWCEDNNIDYLFGLARNSRLVEEIEAMVMYDSSGEASRRFKDFRYQTRKSWSRERRVVGKAEYLGKGANPRFVVTSLGKAEYDAQTLYEDEYCARGDMENRIKEQQLMLFADRTSTATIRANQLRLYFSSVAYTLMQALRRLGLAGTKMAKAQCNTIRLKLLKIGAQVRVIVWNIWVAYAEGCPYAGIVQQVYRNLCRIPIHG